MEGNTKSVANRKRFNLARTKVKLLAAYYGHPARDLRLICITGSTGKTTVAHYVHEILRAASQPVAILASEREVKPTVLHKFLNDAWKAKATYAVITAPATALNADTFFGLPIYVAALTDFIPSSLNSPDIETYLNAKSTLFRMNPEAVVLNRDDAHYPDFAGFRGTSETITYGASSDSDLRIEQSKLYRKGAEANLSIGNQNFTVASFLTGEPTISYMACAAAIATALNIAPGTIADGIACYEPEAPATK
jgi:UDP-N-acetylmuramyl tripeptide synthase